MYSKHSSLAVSEAFFSLLGTCFSEYIGYLETFNNCREQGYCLINYDKDYVVWAFEARNSDEIVVIVGTLLAKNNNNMFNDIAYQYRKCYQDISEAVYKTAQTLADILEGNNNE